MSFCRWLFVVLSLLIHTACTPVRQYPVNAWPDALPPRAYFTAYYAHDTGNQTVLSEETYLIWVRRFYEGWVFYPNGWLQTTQKLAETLPTAEQQLDAHKKMQRLGKLISAEWAKNDKYRVINTRMLVIWGAALRESVIQREQLALIDRVVDDVENLLAGSLSPVLIVDSRYYQNVIYENDPFADS